MQPASLHLPAAGGICSFNAAGDEFESRRCTIVYGGR